MERKNHKKVTKHMERIGLKLVRDKRHMVFNGYVNNQKVSVTYPCSAKNQTNAINYLNKDIRREFIKVGAEEPPKLER